jgi:hypothetical protein
MMGVEVAFLRLLRLEIPSIEMWAAVLERVPTEGIIDSLELIPISIAFVIGPQFPISNSTALYVLRQS